MLEYIVKVTSISGRRGKVFRQGETVTSNDFNSNSLNVLLKNKYIEEFKSVIPDQPVPFVGKIKLGIVTGVWQRPEIFELFAKGVLNLHQYQSSHYSSGWIKDTDFEIIVAGSEGLTSKKMVNKYGFHYIEIKNDPLAEKMNATIARAKVLGCTHVLCVGSDDIITPLLMEKYIEYIRNGYDYIGVLDWYFYDTVTKKSLYWGGYRDERRKGYTCGAGRILSASLLNKWGWQVWENKHSKVLDNSMQEKLKRTKHSIKTFTLKEFGLYALDIKSSTNMTPFDVWDNAHYINTEIIKSTFSFLSI